MGKTSFAMVAACLFTSGCVLDEGPDIAPVAKEMVVTAQADINSAHPYLNHTNQSWELTAPADAQSVIVTFDRFESESGYDWVDLYDADGELIHHLSGTHSGESFTVPGHYTRVHFTSDYSITGWGIAISEFRYEIDDPGHPTDHRPYCGAIGSRSEGWYWGDTDELIKFELCADMEVPRCGAIGSRSEGWYTDAGLITWDFCHSTVRISVYGENCGGSIGFTCHDNLYCHGWPIEGVIGGSGTCKWTGYCEEPSDCSAEGNQWDHVECNGHAECNSENNQCAWHCDPPPQGPWSWTSHLVADVASAHPYANDTDLSLDVVGSPGATQIKIEFSRIDTEAGYDQIMLSGDVEENALMIEGHHQNYETPVFNGNTIHVNFRSDYSITDWGFAVASVSFYEQLAPGLCNRDEDCGDAGQFCFPHHCINPYAPCYGQCQAMVAGGLGDTCNDFNMGCEEGLFCKGVTEAGEGTCQNELWCDSATVAADCVNVIHPAVPGLWSCASNQCSWQAGMTTGAFYNNNHVAIPDDDSAGITSEVAVNGLLGCDRRVAVDVNIDHSYRGDLVVILTDPRGVQSVLSNRDGGSADNFRLDEVAVDGALGADGIIGTWALHVSDHAGLDVGTLTGWGLHMSCD